MLSALPDGRCQANHWGYLLEGRFEADYGTRSDLIEAGSAYYLPAGHRITVLGDPRGAGVHAHGGARRNDGGDREASGGGARPLVAAELGVPPFYRGALWRRRRLFKPRVRRRPTLGTALGDSSRALEPCSYAIEATKCAILLAFCEAL
jgi:hypothetical protein